ncbi:MAG: M28 family peptidase [Polyangia bacterium]
MKHLGLLLCAAAGALLLRASALAAPPSLAERALASHVAYDHAVRIADEVGERMAGTPAADRGVAWALAELKALGFADAHTEPVTLATWQRGSNDLVELVAPYPHTLHALALGHSPPTAAGGLTAEVVEVTSFEELAKLGDKVRGKIVFFDGVMKRSQTFDEYGRVGQTRFHGGVAAGKLGAVGALVRSAGTGAHRLPHTGCTFYDPKVPAIPFAALAAEDAGLLHRALVKGPARIKMVLGGGMHPQVTSANVVAEVRGREKPDEIVLVGAHLDSWDVGDGAIDDGAGVGIAMQTMTLVKALRPRRTVRIALFMNEECGTDGSAAYGKAHAAEAGKYVAAMEADEGAGAPLHWSVSGDEKSRALVTRLAGPIASIVKDDVSVSDQAGTDLAPLRLLGVPGVNLSQDATDYFEWHHTDGDTADKIDPIQMNHAAAAFAAMVVQLANSDETPTRSFPRPRP